MKHELSKRTAAKIQENEGQSMKDALRHLVTSVSGTHVEEDLDSIVKLCIMASIPTGEENPREIMRSISYDMLKVLVKQYKLLTQNPLISPVYQFFLLEFCYREGHFVQDWKWQWEDARNGNASYDSDRPIEEILHMILNTH